MSGSSTYIVGVRINGDARGLATAAQEALRYQRLLSTGSVREYQRMSEARALLGTRSEREVQREIQRTEAAYNRLARSGTLSWQEQRMAAKGMREEVTRLTNEMGRLTTRQKLAMGAKVVGALGAATMVAGATVKPKLDRAISFQDRLRDVANVASDVGAPRAEREKEYAAAQEAITKSVRYGGGNRDDALDAYNQMVSKGSTFVGDLPRVLLPEIMKAATATSSAANDMAAVAAAGIQNFGMPKTPEAAKEWFNIAAIGGKLGGFEVRQQAAFLPEQMALAGNVGMRGKVDFASLVMLNEAAEKTAGTPDKAATNVKQFLTDVGSNYFRRKAQKVTGVNFAKYATEKRLNEGQSMIDSAMELVDTQVQKHPAYQQLKGRLATTADPEERDKISSAMKIVEGSVSSQFFRNQESAQVVAAYRLHKQFMKEGQQKALTGGDEIGAAFDFKQQGAAYQVNKLAIEQAAAMQSTMDKLTPSVAGVSTKLAELMQQYPGYTTAIITATGALGFLATAAGAAALFGARPGGGAPIVPPAAGGAAAGAGAAGGAAAAASGAAKPVGGAAAAAAGAGRAGGIAGTLSRAAGFLGKVGLVSAVSGLFMTSDEELAILKEADRKKQHAQGAPGAAPAPGAQPPQASPVQAGAQLPRIPPAQPGPLALTLPDGGADGKMVSPAPDSTRLLTQPEPAKPLTYTAPPAAVPSVIRVPTVAAIARPDAAAPGDTKPPAPETKPGTAATKMPPAETKAAAPETPTGFRGAGFDDPRLLTRADSGLQSLGDRVAARLDTKAATRDAVQGEITVRIVTPQGVTADAQVTKPFGGAKVNVVNLGRTNTGAGS